MAHASSKPLVYLVGAGPGDPGLLTLKGRDAIACADAVVYDRLVSPRTLDHARPDAVRIYVGKGPRSHAMPQEEINGLLVRLAREGNVVARVKGGDPFVFGRGGEEAEELRAAGIPYEVVPGVTSAVAAPAYAGIPVTHRGTASSFTVITGHGRAGKEEPAVPWDQAARLGGTLVFLMGMERLPEIAEGLMGAGMDGATPAAVVRLGTWPEQRTVEGTLDGIADAVRDAGVENPAVVVVGQVAALRPRIQWIERKPLFGRRVVVTRARRQASRLTRALEARGAQVTEFPVIEIAPPSSSEPLARAARSVEAYQWVVFTSANGVEAFFEALDGSGRDARALADAEVAAIGPATAAALARHGITRVGMGREYCGEGLAEELAKSVRPGQRVLVARAQESRDVLPRMLEAAGAHVDDVAAYRTIAVGEGAPDLAAELRAGRVDAVTFTSSSTVTNLLACLGGDTALLRDAALCSIGPVTTKTLRDAGLEPAVQADEYTIEGLVDAICSLWKGGSR